MISISKYHNRVINVSFGRVILEFLSEHIFFALISQFSLIPPKSAEVAKFVAAAFSKYVKHHDFGLYFTNLVTTAKYVTILIGLF